MTARKLLRRWRLKHTNKNRWAVVLLVLSAGCLAPPREPSVDDIRSATALIDEGTLRLRNGEFSKAEAAFSVARDLSALPASIDGLGCVAFLEGDFDNAERLFIEAYKAGEGYVNSLGNLALLYEVRGDYLHAEALYRRAIKEDPGNFRVRGNFGAILADSLERSRGRQELLKAEAIAPHPLIRENLRMLE